MGVNRKEGLIDMEGETPKKTKQKSRPNKLSTIDQRGVDRLRGMHLEGVGCP